MKMENNKAEYENLSERIKSSETIAIYGAGIIAVQIIEALKILFNKKPEYCIVSDATNEIKWCNGIDVVTIDGVEHTKEFDILIIATPEIYHKEIVEILTKKTIQIKDYLCIDSHIEYLIMSNYFRKKNSLILLEDMPTLDRSFEERQSIGVYMACCEKDKAIKNKYNMPDYVVKIQAGAKTASKQLEMLHDNEADNISEKNCNYSELTVTYWSWKNRDNDYIGICHYRRMLLLDINKIKNVDVVLPLPYLCYPTTKSQYERYISDDDQERMFDAIKKVSPEYYDDAKRILDRELLYNYNMVIAKKEIFNEYCTWLFDVLFEVENICKLENLERNDRYLGYIGEVLTSIFFIRNQKRFIIGHAEKVWMV